jgi:hypothetical protein
MKRMKYLAMLAAMVLGIAASGVAQEDYYGQRPTAADKYGHSEVLLARVDISGPPVQQMFLSSQQGKQYLYVDQGQSPGVTVLDVTNPKAPKVIKRNIAWPGDSANGQLEAIGATGKVALSEVQEGQQQRPQPSEINVLDLTDPSQPKLLASIKNVTAVLHGGNLLYVANDKGVSVIQQQPTEAEQHQCTSEAAISEMPDCY